MIDFNPILLVMRLFGLPLRILVSLALGAWNRFLVYFIAGDIEAAVVDRSSDSERVPFKKMPSGVRPTASIAEDTTDNHLITLNCNSKELLWISIKYNGPLTFDSFRWWVKFPQGYRILREQDAESESLPALADTSHHNGDDVLINPDRDPTYDNLARSPTSNKHFHVIERDMMRWDLDAYATGQEAIAPIWVLTPDGESGEHYVEIEIDPPSTPISINKSVEVNLS